MSTSYTPLIGLALPAKGELSGTWGDTVNNYITEYTDAALAGAQVISGSQTSVTLSKTEGTALVQAGAGGSTGSSQYQIIRCTGNPASTLTITAPATSKTYVVINATSTNQSVVIRGAGPTTGVTILAGQRGLVAWNGTDFVNVTLTDRLVSAGGTALLDASGNLGLGVTPSAWNSGYNAFDIGGGSISGRISTNNQVDIASNAFRNTAGNWVYKYTGPATRFTVDGSGPGYQWYTAPSGTAGNAISFTQAMTLDASGNLGLGTTSPTAKLAFGIADVIGEIGRIGFDVAGNQRASISAYRHTAVGQLTDLIFNTSGAERARLSSAGGFSLGTTTDAGSGNILTNGSNIVIGNGTVGEKQLFLHNSVRSVYFFLNPSSDAGLYDATSTSFRWTTDTSGNFVANGNVTAYSDIRLKTDLQQITDALSKVEQLTGYTYTRTDTGERQTGLVAQEVEKVLPEAVVQGEHLSLAYGNMVGLLVEAVKELSARVKELEAR